jgi:hypothetical protein
MAYIKGKQLAQGTIDTRELKDSGVTNAKIAASTIEPSRLNISGQTYNFSSASSLSVPTPTAAGHAATKAYVDSSAQGLDVKESVLVATTSSNDLTGFSFSGGVWSEDTPTQASFLIDQVALSLGARVLIKNASNGAHNGIFEVSQVGDGLSTSWELTRAADFDSDDKVTNGAFVFVGDGTANEGAGFVLVTNDPITLDTSALNFTQFSGAGSIDAGTSLEKVGNTLNVVYRESAGLGDLGVGAQISFNNLPTFPSLATSEVYFIGAGKSSGGNYADNTPVQLGFKQIFNVFQGNGLAVDLGSVSGSISVDIDTAKSLEFVGGKLALKLAASSSLSQDANGLKVVLEGDGSVTIGASGLKAAVPVADDTDKNTASNISTDETATGLTISNTPAADSLVMVMINGVKAALGDGVKSADCYFSADGGTTARAVADIAAGDELIWNGASVYTLETGDSVDFIYNA